MKDHVADLYRALVNGGYNVDDLGGSVDGFREAMSDSVMRKEFYDWVGRRGNFRLPDYDVYESALASTYDGLKSEVSPEEAKENTDSINGFLENRHVIMQPQAQDTFQLESEQQKRDRDAVAQRMEDQAEAVRQRLQEEGTIDRMKESKKDARRDKLRAFGSMLGSTPQVTSFGVSTNVFDSTDEQLADVGQALDAGTEYRQNKLLQEKLDVALDMARAGENQDGLRGVENFGLGLWDSATRLSTWDFGASDIVNNLTLQQIVEKWENDPSSLTATEKKVLDGIGMATAVQELYSDQVGIGYNVGQSLPESASFMMGMALNPASGLGKSLARNAVRTYGRNSIAKNLARIGGDIAETAIMTATTGAGRVAADALERINGSSTYEIADNGVIMYGGQKDQETVGNAVIKAIGSNFIENYSEALGEYFDPLLGMSRKVAAGGLRKMNLNKWADALSDVQPSQMTASIRSLREKTKFGGIFGEVMEEEIGMALNAISGVGDYTFSKEKAEKEGKQWIFDLENQLTTVLSCAIMSGTLNGVEQVFSVAARRRMEKNAKNAEQEASYRFSRDKFAPLREAIDQASPEGMVDVLRDVYMSQEYTVGQKRALAEYAAARLQLQYYNAADAKARRQVNKTQQELLDAQEAGLNAQLPQFYNIARAAQNAEEDLLDYEGDYNLIDIIRSCVNKPEEMERILGDLPPREAQLVTNYIYSRARMEGAYQGRSNRAEDYIDDFAYALEPAVVTDTEGNRTITTALLGDRSVYVLENNGDLAHIMRPDGSKTLVKASELTNITTSSAEEVIDRYRDMYTFEYNAETENAFEHHPKTQAPQVGLRLQSPEGEVVITAVNDNMVEIVPAVYKDGQVQPKEGAEPKTITVDDAYAWQDDYYLSMDADQTYANAMAEANNVSAETAENEGTPNEQIEQSVSEEVADGQNSTQPTETESVASVAPAAPQTARERVPKDKKGNPIYEQTDADTAWDAIVEETEGDTEMAQRVAADMLEDKKAALAKLQKGKPKKGATVAEKIANEKAHQAAIAQAQSDVAQWEAIVGTEARRREAAMSEADRYAAEMEQKSINEGLTALGEPQSLEEYVLGQLAGGAYKLRWSDKENGTKGFGSHTGLSTEEMKARLSMIDNKNGLTPEEIAHSIVENMDASFGDVDVMDVTNMVIDAVATNASRRAMLNGMVESRAELMRQQARAEQEAKDAWYMEQYHATEEELAAYSEYLAEITEEIIADDANYEERFNTFAELIADEYDNQGTDADIRSSADQGEGLASDREGGRSVGEGEEIDRQGSVLGDAPRFAEAEDGRAGSSVSAQSDDRQARIDRAVADYRENVDDSPEAIAAAERDQQRYEADMAEDAAETVETLENGDVRRTNRNSNGEIATVAIERDGKVVSVDTYEDGALFEHTDYDANGNATKVTRYKDGKVVSEQEYKDGKRKVTANVFEMAEEAQKKRKSKKEKDVQQANQNLQEEESKSEARGVRDRLQPQDDQRYESFIGRLKRLIIGYKGTAPTEEVAKIIRDFNNGKTLLARTEQERELLKMLRVMTNQDIDYVLSEIEDVLSSDAINEDDRKRYKDAVSLINKFKNRGERKAIIRGLTGAELGDKLPLTKIDELFEMYNSDADVAELYRRVRAIAEQIGLDFWFDDNMDDEQTGGYLDVDNRVRLNAHMLYSPYVTQQEKASVIVHEILHAVADYAIKTQKDIKLGLKPGVQLPKQVLSAANSILNIYEKVVKDNPLLVHEEYDPAEDAMKVVPDYGTSSAREMLMEISNPEFRDKLKQVEYNSRSVWQRIWDAIKSMFTQSSDVTNPTAYDSMAKALDVLINEFSVDAYQKYSGLEESAMKLSADENLRFREKEEPKELIAVHNISEGNLKKVLEAGSLIMPSIAITKADMGHTGFGEISLLFDKSTINPSDRRNKVYGGDAWTPRFPRIGVKLNEKVVSRINKKAYESIDDRRLREIFSLSSEVYPDNIEKVISDYGVEGYYNKEWVKLAYLLDNGKKVKIPTKAKDYGIASEDIVRLAKEKGLSVKEIYEDYNFYKNNPDFVAQVKEARDEARLSSIPEEQRDEMRERMQSRPLSEAAFDSYIRGALEMEDDLAHGGLKEIVDRQALRDLIEKKVKTDNAEYNKWVDNLFEGIVEKRGIRNNRDWYTPSGNLRPWGQLYDPATPANILKYMLAENEQGGSGGLFDSNIMGASAETYESIEEIREKGKKRLKQLPYEEYDEWSNSIADRMAKICDDFLSPSQKNSIGGAIDAKIEITNAVAKDKTAKGIYKHMKREYPNFTMEHAKQVEEIVKEIQEFATGYFEAKPQRLVSVNEVMAAVVPSNANKEIVDALKSNGIEVITYKKGDEEARKRVVKRVSSSMGIRFRDGAPFFSNAERAVENIKQQKATPEQWLAMIKKDGGLKAGEDKWMGLSDWLNEQKEKGVKTLTKDEVLAFIRENQIEIEEVEYGEELNESAQRRLDELNKEYTDRVHRLMKEWSDAYDENERFEKEMHKKYGDGFFYMLDESEQDKQAELENALSRSEPQQIAYEEMVEVYGDKFESALEMRARKLTPTSYYPSGNLTDEAREFLGADNGINATRLDYTTEGLDNKREIALVVPTIEPWNQTDTIHFGDAGEGRAVAWVRFGETTDEDGNRVLVIDEVQSKRHDEGRAKGYQSKEKGDLLAERDRLYDKMYRDGLTEEEFNRRNEINARLEELGEGRIPDAPFDKNYHELVMKRMLRYAAENGFDKVAWTKGAQQAKRYGLNKVVDAIDASNFSSDTERDVRLTYTNEQQDNLLVRMSDGVVVKGDINGSSVEGQKLSDIIGKDAADKLLSTTDDMEIKGDGLNFGGEDRNALYDEMIPRFMRKYVKKWGTKVGEVTLPNVEEAGRTMWSVDVTPEMRESVMQGQPMFREGMGAISDREVSYENDPIAKWQGKPRYYGKRASAFAERERARMQKGVEEAAKILGIDVEIITDASILKGRKAKAKGWYDINAKKVVVVVPNHVSKGDAVGTVLHEGVAHHGLRELFGDGFDAMLDNVYNNVSPELKARIDAIAERTGVSTSVATEEYLASLAETTNFEEAQRRGWWQKIKSYFVDMLRKLSMPGLKLKEEITDNELRYLLWRSYKNLVEPNSYLRPLGYAEDVVKQKELKVGEYAEKTQATPMAADTSEAEEWAAVTMQRIEELEAQAAQLENEITDMEADRDADDESRYDMWEQQLEPLLKQMEDVYAELEGLYSLEAEDEDIEAYEEEREAEKQRQLYQKRIDNAYLKAVREGDWEEATDLFRQYVLSKAEDEGIVPMDYGVGYRGGAHSSIAKKVKEENPDAIAEAAYQMSIRIPKGSILVPMPSRTGSATYTVKLAEAIAKATNSEVRDVLKGKARMSVYEAKQKGIKMNPEDLGMYTTEELPKGKNIVIIDNVIDKGTTALAAVSAVKGASVVAYAYTLGDKQRAATLKLAEPVTYDDNKRIIPLSQRFNKESDDIRYRMSINEEEFDNTQREAVKNIGIVMPNLGDAEVNIVDVPRHDFTGTGKEAISKAREWANRELVGEHVANEGTKEEFKYSIDEKSVKKFLSGVSTSLSDNLGVHLSVLKKLPSVIDSSIEAEIHADYKKGEQRDANNGIEDENLLIHRLYGCARINGELYRVKTTIKERKSAGVKPYTYEVTKIELLDGSSQEGTSSSDASSNSISGAKLLKGVEKSYDKGKLLLDESKKVSENSINSEEIIAEVERESANLGVQVRIARSIEELPDEDTRKRAEDGKLKGYFDPRTGEVVVYLPNTENANDAKRTILHEIVGHKGLRSLIGEQQYDKAMLQLMYMLPANVRDAVLRRAERHGWNAAIAMDEYLAEQAERDVQPTWWGKVNAKIRALLRNMGFNVMLTDADVTYLLWRSRKKLQGDTAFDMATDAILKQAARKSAEAEAWNEQAFKDAEMRDFERNTLPSIRHRMGANTNDYEKAVRTLGFKQAEAWQDSMRSLLVFQQALAKASGKDISDFENSYMYENRMSSANLMEMEQYRHMVYNPLLKAIHELEQIGASRESIINYLFAKSGLERNEVFARRDAKKHAEGDAAKEQQLYDKYRQKDYAGLTALTRGDAQIAALVDDHSKKKTEYERLEQNKKRGVAVSDADLKAAKKEMNDARKAMITAIEAEAQRMVDEFEAQHNTDNLWDKIRNCTHTTLNISHDAGVMSDEVYNELWNQFQYYIPLRGFAETTAEDVYLYLGGSDSPYNAPIKTAYGRTSLADDPIATIGNMAESAIVEANRNRLKQRFLYMVERHNTDLASISDVWLDYDDVNDEWHTVFAQIPDDATPSEAKRLQQEFEDRMKLLAEQNPGKYANASQQPNIPYRVVKKGDRQEHHVIVKRNGKDVVITINGNPRVAQAINGLTNPEQNQGMITRITSWINRNLSANFTMRNPAFMVSNFVRDGFYTNSMVWVKENPAYAWQYNQNWMKCTAQIASLVKRYKRYEKGDTSALDMNNDMDRMFYEFVINGGETGYTVIKSVEDYKGLISGEMKKMEAGAMGTARRVADTIGNVVDTFGRWAEDTSRFAAYMTSRQLGRTVTKSIWDAKEISVNFNKKGSGNRMMGKFEQGNRLNYVLSNMSQLGRNLYVFWNAGMQGLNNFSKAAKKSPAKFTAMAGTYFTLGVIVAAAFSGDDDEDDYYNLPEYVRRNNICFKIGKGKYATLPLPIEIRAIYGLGELAYSYLSGREGLTHGEAVTKTIQQITQIMPIDMMADGGGAMALVPSAAKPVVEVIHNVDWTGRPIYKEKTPWNQNDPTWTLAFKSTSPELVQMSRLVNEWTNKNTADGLERPYNRGWADNRYLNNPAVWEHIAEGYLGGVATMFNQTKKTLMMPFNEDLREVRNVPIASRFIKDAGKEGRSYASRNEYYDAKNIMDSWKNEMSKAKKEVLDESLTDEQRLKAAKLRSSLEQQYTEAAERWKVLDRQRKALEETYKNDQSEENRQALDDVMMQMATLVEAYRD